MVTEPSSARCCPGLETWCAYVEGSIGAASCVDLAAHLEACDRCFATVLGLRSDLADLDAGSAPVHLPPRSTPAARRATRRGAYTAAVTLALVWAALWQVTTEVPLTPDPLGRDAEPGAGGRFGFVARAPASPLRGSVRLHIVFAQFGGAPAREVPAWVQGLLGPGLGPSLARRCGDLGRVSDLHITILPGRYRSRLPAAAYTAGDPLAGRRRFAGEILAQLPHWPTPKQVTDVVVVILSGGSAAAGLGHLVPGTLSVVEPSGPRCWVVAEDETVIAAQICRLLRQASTP